MPFNNKILRYYYWFVTEFIKKYLRLILLSFFVSLLVIISLISITPYLENYLGIKKNVIGMVGNYDFNKLPDEITTKISNGLIFINEKGEILPALASSWELMDNDKKYRIHLKKNLYWNDGSNFTASNVNYRFKDVEVKTIDKNLIEFKLNKPLAVFLTYLTKPIIKYPLNGVAGLYKVERYRARYGLIKEVYLTPNKRNLPIILYKFFDNETKMIDAYKLGEINQMIVNKKSVADIFATWKNTQVVKNVDYTHLLTLFFNLNSPVGKEKDVRQAIEMGLDKQKLLNYGQITSGPIAPISWAYNPNLRKDVFDPERAKKILEKYIIASSAATINFNTYYDYLDIANEIDNMLNNIGLHTNLNLLSLERPNNFDILLAFLKVPLDPDQYYFWHSTQEEGNITDYKNLKVDKLLEDGRNILSADDRKKIYFEFQKIINDDCPAFFLYFPYTYTIKRK